MAQTRRTRRRVLNQARAGSMPAEAIADRGDREQLVYELWTGGWTDVDIASHTMWTTYTVARIRERLGLAANAAGQEGAA